MEENTTDEALMSDDPHYWDDIVEELLDIEAGPAERRSREPSITITNPDPPDPSLDPEDDDDVNNIPVLSDVYLDRPYIFEDPDSEALLSENNSEYVPHDDSENEDIPDGPSGEFVEVDLGSVDAVPAEYLDKSLLLCTMIEYEDMEGVNAFIEDNVEEISAICMVSDESGTSPVTAAASLGRVDFLDKLFSAGVWLSCADGDGKVAIHRAAENGHTEAVEWLAKQGQWTSSTKDGMSALHIAAKQGHFQTVNTLLEFVQNVDEVTCSDCKTAVQLAAENNHGNIIEVLLGKGADPNQTDSHGMTALHTAASAGHSAVVDVLLMYDTNVNMQLVSSGKTALHLAVEKNYYQVTGRLVEGGANVDIKDSSGETVLHKLHKSELPVDAMDLLCRKSEAIDAKNKKGKTALLIAAENGNIDGTLVLIQNHADVNFEAPTGNSPLYSATHYGHWDVVDKLLLAGANVNKMTENGSTPLYKASRNNQLHIVALLLCSGAKVNLARKTGWSPLHVAVHHANDTIVEQLIAAGADYNMADNIGQTPLAIAGYMKHESTVKVILKACQDPIAFYNAAKLGNKDVLKFLIQCGADIEISNPSFGWRAIHYAAQDGHANAVAALGYVNVDINVQDSDGNTPLHMAILHKHARVVEVLLKQHCYIGTTNKKGESCMSLAVQTGNLRIVQLLFSHGAGVDVPDAEGLRPLSHAIQRRHSDIANLLISYGAKVGSYEDDPSAVSPIQLVCRLGGAEIFKVMVNRGVSLEQTDGHNNTLLHTAAHHGQLDIVFELITMRRSLVNMENSMGKKPLHLAALEGHPLVVETLLSAGTKVSVMDDDDTVLYEMAKHKEVWDVLKQWASTDPAMLEPTSPQHRQRSRRNSPAASSASSDSATDDTFPAFV